MKNIKDIKLEKDQYIELGYIQIDESGSSSWVKQEIYSHLNACEEVEALNSCSNISHLTIKLVEVLNG